MQVGSLVECIYGFAKRSVFPHEIQPIIGQIYTVRSFYTMKGKRYMRVVEIINKPDRYSDGLKECGFSIGAFHEIQPPMDVSALFKDI